MLKFYHSPNSRSTSILWLLEELNAPYDIELVNIRDADGAPENYRLIHPNKKVPAIIHNDIVVTERAAITIYLADLFPESEMAPVLGDARRASYLSMLVYCDSVMDPAMASKALKWDYKSSDVSFGNFEDMLKNLERKLSAQLYAAGSEFTAADTQLAHNLYWGMNVMSIIPKKKIFLNYLEKIMMRPAFLRAMELDKKFTNEPFANFDYLNDVPAFQKSEKSFQESIYYGDGFS